MFLQKLQRFVQEEEAATAVEYAVVLMLIAGSIIATIQALGGSTSAFFDANRDNIEQALDQQHF